MTDFPEMTIATDRTAAEMVSQPKRWNWQKKYSIKNKPLRDSFHDTVLYYFFINTVLFEYFDYIDLPY
jgi:hypothetical protein